VPTSRPPRARHTLRPSLARIAWELEGPRLERLRKPKTKNHPGHQAQRRAQRLDSTASRSPLQAGLCRLTCSAVSRVLSLVRFARAACPSHEIARAIANATAAANGSQSADQHRLQGAPHRRRTAEVPLHIPKDGERKECNSDGASKSCSCVHGHVGTERDKPAADVSCRDGQRAGERSARLGLLRVPGRFM